MLHIRIRVATADGWLTFGGDVPDGSDLLCYSLPKAASRADFWSAKLGMKIPNGPRFDLDR